MAGNSEVYPFDWFGAPEDLTPEQKEMLAQDENTKAGGTMGSRLRRMLAPSVLIATPPAGGFDWDAHPDAEAQPNAGAAPAQGFDWDAHPDAQSARAPAASAQPAEGPGGLEAILRGGAQGATLGFSDELGAVPAAIGQFFTGGETDANGKPLSTADVYREYRDEERAKNAAAEKAHGGLYLTGNIGGGLLTAPLGGSAKGLGALLKAGAKLGAANGLGTSEADLTQGQVLRAGLDTVAGGALGAGAAGLGYGVAKGVGALAGGPLRALAKKLEDVGIAQGRRVLSGGSEPMSIKAALPDDVVREALDSKAIRLAGTTKGAALRLKGIRAGLGEKYSALVKQLSAKGIEGPDAHQVALDLLDHADQVEARTLGDPGPDLFRKHAEELVTKQTNPNGRLNLGLAEDIKRSLQQQASKEYDKLAQQMTPSGEAKMEVAAKMRQAIEDSIQGQASKAPEEAAQFVPVKQQLGRVIKASDAATKGANQAAKRNAFSLRDMFALHKAGPIGMVASHLARTRGTSTVAAGAYGAGGLANALAGVPAELGSLFGGALGRGAQDVEAGRLGGLLPAMAQDDEEEARRRGMLAALRGR